MHALWFIVFAWLFFGGTTMRAKRANRKVKLLPVVNTWSIWMSYFTNCNQWCASV